MASNMTIDQKNITQTIDKVSTFSSVLTGSALRPDDPGYDDARVVWNGAIDKRPAIIVRCAGVADVIDAVKCAHFRAPCCRQGRWSQRGRKRRLRRRYHD